jgi:hypothetical protein
MCCCAYTELAPTRFKGLFKFTTGQILATK